VKLSILAVLALTASADAGTLADAIARHDAAAVKALRAQVTDPASRCTLGVVYARRSDLPRAALYLAGCGDADLPAEISADVARTVSEVRAKLEASQLSKIEIATKPEGMQVELLTLAKSGADFPEMCRYMDGASLPGRSASSCSVC